VPSFHNPLLKRKSCPFEGECGGLRGKRREAEAELLLKIGFHNSSDSIDVALDVATHGGILEDPTSIFRSPLEVMGVTLQLLDFNHTFMRIVIPAKQPLIAGVRESKID